MPEGPRYNTLADNTEPPMAYMPEGLRYDILIDNTEPPLAYA
jgi:hypothetical protein